MTYIEKIIELAKINNGMVTATQVSDAMKQDDV